MQVQVEIFKGKRQHSQFGRGPVSGCWWVWDLCDRDRLESQGVYGVKAVNGRSPKFSRNSGAV